MSIFQSREWWSFTPDEYVNKPHLNRTSVAISTFPNATGDQSDVIVSGNLAGTLRIFSPYRSVEEIESNNASLLLEMELQTPILQIALGKLSSR